VSPVSLPMPLNISEQMPLRPGRVCLKDVSNLYALSSFYGPPCTLLGRLTPPSRPSKAGLNICPPARPSTKSFSDMSTSDTRRYTVYDPIQGQDQGHGGSKVEKMTDFKVYRSSARRPICM